VLGVAAPGQKKRWNVIGVRRQEVRGRKLTLDDAQVMRIRAALATGATIRALAKRFGVSTTTIKGAAVGRGAYGGVETQRGGA
jgi:hypothetical protein